jgi:hypothetical protein
VQLLMEPAANVVAGRMGAHLFKHCPCISDLWDSLYAKMVPGFPSDWEQLLLAFLACLAPAERLVVAHLGVLVSELWEARSCL